MTSRDQHQMLERVVPGLVAQPVIGDLKLSRSSRARHSGFALAARAAISRPMASSKPLRFSEPVSGSWRAWMLARSRLLAQQIHLLVRGFGAFAQVLQFGAGQAAVQGHRAWPP